MADHTPQEGSDNRVCARDGCRKKARKRGKYCSDSCQRKAARDRTKKQTRAILDPLAIPTPADHRAERVAKQKARFLEAFGRLGIVALACAEAGIKRRQTPYEWAEADPQFATDWEYARGQAADTLEAEARRRAYEGVVKPLMAGGRIIRLSEITGNPADSGKIATILEYSDKLLERMLEANNPKYRRAGVIEITGAGGGPIQHEHTDTFEYREHIADELSAFLAGRDSAGADGGRGAGRSGLGPERSKKANGT